MKRIALLLLLLPGGLVFGQPFDYYGPQPFGEILNNSFAQSWTPTSVAAIENRKYVVLLDAATQSVAVMQSASDVSAVSAVPVEDVHGSASTYGSMLRSIFQIVDINTHLDNTEVPLSGEYRLNPMLHSYFGMNADAGGTANLTDGGTRYVADATNTGYVLVVFDGTPDSATIKAVSQWEYDAAQDSVVAVAGWSDQWLMIDGTEVSWTASEAEASRFFVSDANGLIDVELESGSAFNPLSVAYQPNETAALPEVPKIEDSRLLTDLEREVDEAFLDQFGTSATAAAAASAKLDEIESTLSSHGAALRYPKAFYLAVRENMLSHTFASTDVYNGGLGFNTVPHVYFTNASDDDGVPHPFMVVIAHAASTRPNLLVDVNRPPGSRQDVGYAESPVTRHGKLGEFVLKIPLKDYGLINSLLDNDLSAFGGDLASDFDVKQGTTTEKNQYNYAGLASIGVAMDGVTLYPAQNNNLRFAVADGEVTHSGIHVGGGLELHYHADGHAFSGNGINLYNLSDYEGHDHPPVIGMAHDGIALFGRYEATYSSMVGSGIALDIFGGHDHGDGFGYHYHAHTETVENSAGGGPSTTFDEHFLLVGAWKGQVNDIPGFDEGKLNQFRDPDIARYAGASFVGVGGEPPVVIQAIDDIDLVLGGDAFTHDLATVFSDADGDTLSFSASSSDATVATATVSGQSLTVEAVTLGSATITVMADDGNGGTASTSFTVSIDTGVAAEHGDGLPTRFELSPNYPNPFNPATQIVFGLPQTALVRLSVFDVLGREVVVLVDERLLAGWHEAIFDADDLPSGFYLYQLEVGGRTLTRMMLLMK